MSIMSTLFPIVLLVVAVGVFYLFRRRDSGRPKEIEATLTELSESGGVYTFTFDLKGETKVLRTGEAYYSKLRKGDTGMLAYKGKTLIDFERFNTRR